MIHRCEECDENTTDEYLCLGCRNTRYCFICHNRLETDFEKYTYAHLDCVNNEQYECLMSGVYVGVSDINNHFIIIDDDPVYTCVSEGCDRRISTYHHEEHESFCQECIFDKIKAEDYWCNYYDNYDKAEEEYWNDLECPYCLMARVNSPIEHHGENCPI